MRSLFVLLVAVFAVACTAAAVDPVSSRHGVGANGDTSSGGSGGGSGAGSGSGSGGLGASSGGTPDAPSGLPCDVDAVLAAHCRTCHGSTPSFGASIPLVTWQDLTAQAPDSSQKVYQLVESRIHDDARPMPPTPNPRLSAADATTIDHWVAAGAPSSTATCAGAGDAGGGPVVDPLPCTPDVTMRPATPYTMPTGTNEQYVCYGFDVTVTSKRHVIALAPKIDNSAILHHLLLFQSNQSESPTPTPCASGGSTSWSLIGGWAPGGKNIILPPEAGFPESGTTHWVLQVHYNNAKGLPSPQDSSGFDMCSTDQLRPNDAGVMAFGSVNFSIPPRSALNLTCTVQYSTSFPKVHVFSATPHMHLLGKSLTTNILPGGSGAPVNVVSQPAWDFQTQVAYPANNDINPGDSVVTQCDWNNTTDSAVTFGENTENEMCFSFLAYYPLITQPLFSWVTPSAVASCQ
jgi:cytochrome c551/c552